MPGRQVQQYQLIEKLGEGGMGEIYKAQDTRLNRTVAVKVLPSARSGEPERRRRFLQEAQAASGLNHPSIITVHDVITDGDTEFMVMEFVQGRTLSDLIPKGGLRVPLLIKYALQMADALRVAHAAGIVHRDLKPSNVMVTDSDLVKILDFGLAKLIQPRVAGVADDDQTRMTGAALTVEGAILGTVNYMSPEQAEGKMVDARSDVFSFGTVLYEMATGLRAFAGDSMVSTLSAILRDEPRPISEVGPDVPPPLDQLIQRCLRKNPDDRWQSVKELQEALLALKRESDSGSLYLTRAILPAASGPVAPAPANNSKVMVVLAAAALVLAAGVWWRTTRDAQQTAAGVQTPDPPAAASSAIPVPTPAEPVSSEAPMTNDSVLTMVREKVPVNLILSQIQSAGTIRFDLSTEEVIRLTKGGVTSQVIEQMRNPKRAIAAPSSVSSLAPASVAPVQTAQTVQPGQPARTVNVTVPDALPFRITLAAEISTDADVGQAVRFTAVDDFRVNGTLVIAKGALVQGEISESGTRRRMLGIGGGSKLSFRLSKAEALGGHQLNVRALPVRRRDGVTQRPVESDQRPPSRDIAAAQGTEYIAYIDGEQTFAVAAK